MEYEFQVTGDFIENNAVKNSGYTGNLNTYLCNFTFSEEWERLGKFAVFVGKEPATVEIVDGRCVMPAEFLEDMGEKRIGCFGTDATAGRRISTNFITLDIRQGAYCEANAPAAPEPDLWETYYAKVKEEAQAAQAAEQSAVGQAVEAGTSAFSAGQSALEAAEAKVMAEQSAEEARQSADNAKAAEAGSKGSEAVAAQALADLLAMLGTDVATLVDGKLSPSQIPDLSINDVFEVASVEGLLTLNAQRGDVGLIVAEDVVADSYMLAADDPAVFENWKKLGVSYVANAGHANSADQAGNAGMINNHRVVAMTQEQYDSAVKDPDTVYLVG